MMKTIPILVAAAALAVPAVAAGPVVQRQVHFSDLDLESEAGRATLQRRLDRAVAAICAVDVPGSYAVASEQARCVTETAAGLDAQMAVAIRANRARMARVASN